MSKISPSELRREQSISTANLNGDEGEAEAWTVWMKSSMAFVGSDGFSIFDSNGRLAFRVDNYSRRNKFFLGELLLTDAAGKPLLLLKPKIMSIHERWNGYRTEGCLISPVFTMKRRSTILGKSDDDDVEVYMGGGGKSGEAGGADYRIQGRFKKRSCSIWGRSGELVARVCRKIVSPLVVLDEEVFSLIIMPGNNCECELIMAFIVAMDRICKNPFRAFFVCSH